MSLATLPSIFSDDIFEEDNQQSYDPLKITNPMGLIPDTPLAAPPAVPTTNVAPLPNVVTGQVTNPITGATQQVTQAGSNVVGGAKQWLQRAIFGVDVEDLLFIIVGLLLIAAGLYGFSAVKDTVQAGVRAATEGVA